MTVFNPVAYDYLSGIFVYDCLTKKEYSLEEAEVQSKEVKGRLCVRCRKIGVNVMSLEEVNQLA